MVGLLGPGGIGKTALATRLATEVPSAFSALFLAIGSKGTVYASVRRLMASQLEQRVQVLEQKLLRLLAVEFSQ